MTDRETIARKALSYAESGYCIGVRESIELARAVLELSAPEAHWDCQRKIDALEIERDAYRAMVCDLLSSASPSDKEHSSMSRHWKRARELLKNGPVTP